MRILHQGAAEITFVVALLLFSQMATAQGWSERLNRTLIRPGNRPTYSAHDLGAHFSTTGIRQSEMNDHPTNTELKSISNRTHVDVPDSVRPYRRVSDLVGMSIDYDDYDNNTCGCSREAIGDRCPSGCGDFSRGSCGDGCGGWLFEAEAIFAAYHRSDGMRVGDGPLESVKPGWDVTPRITLGYTDGGGGGLRLRWWDYNHNQPSAANVAAEFLSVDTFNLDGEYFFPITQGCNWSVELSGGVRLNNFEEVLADDDSVFDVRTNSFRGTGGILGIEARHQTMCWGAFYGRLRGSILYGNSNRINGGLNYLPATQVFERFPDTTTAMWEFGLGWQYDWNFCNGSSAFIKLGAEWQKWDGFSSDFGLPSAYGAPIGTLGAGEEVFEGHSNVGFAMAIISVGFVQ